MQQVWAAIGGDPAELERLAPVSPLPKALPSSFDVDGFARGLDLYVSLDARVDPILAALDARLV